MAIAVIVAKQWRDMNLRCRRGAPQFPILKTVRNTPCWLPIIQTVMPALDTEPGEHTDIAASNASECHRMPEIIFYRNLT